MNKIKHGWIRYAAILSMVLFLGCANSVRLEFESGARETMTDGPRTTITKLAENWTDYDIYYSGIRPEVALGILFDPKNDDKKLVPDGDEWVKVIHRETLDQLIHWIADPTAYDGRLYRIFNPEDHFFGYIYMFIDEPYTGAKVVDENSILALPIRKMIRPFNF